MNILKVLAQILMNQYGFRSGRSTIDAINRVKNIAEGAVAQGVALAVPVDIVNAFNSIPWLVIEEGFMRFKLPCYIKRVIKSYLTGRTTEYKGMEEIVRRVIDRGVPQGSVLGSLLWNVGYDAVLNASLPNGVYITCYADDTLLLACGREWTRTIRLMAAGLEALSRKIKSLGLEIATHKTEATWFHGLPQNKGPPKSWIAVGSDRIPVGLSIKYLRLVLDGRFNLKTHFSQSAPRMERVALSLGRLIPNTGCPKVNVRRLYTSVIQSMMLYEAPIWAGEKSMTRKNINTLKSIQRRIPSE